MKPIVSCRRRKMSVVNRERRRTSHAMDTDYDGSMTSEVNELLMLTKYTRVLKMCLGRRKLNSATVTEGAIIAGALVTQVLRRHSSKTHINLVGILIAVWNATLHCLNVTPPSYDTLLCVTDKYNVASLLQDLREFIAYKTTYISSRQWCCWRDVERCSGASENTGVKDVMPLDVYNFRGISSSSYVIEKRRSSMIHPKKKFILRYTSELSSQRN